jgi:diguanylate cyclase (GGDEF)-like protein
MISEEKYEKLQARKLSWKKKYKKFHDEIVAVQMENQRKFSASNAVIFLVCALAVWLLEIFYWKDNGKGQWYCLGLSAVAFVNYLIQRFILPKHRKWAILAGNIYLLIWCKALLSVNLVSGDTVQWTWLLCAFVTTSMLVIMPTHYAALLGTVLALDMIEYCIINQSLFSALYHLMDDCFIAAVCITVNMLHSRQRFQSLEKHEILAGENSQDPLTKLYNRRHLERYYDRTAKKEELSAFVLLDLDNFKMANDMFGHKMGDEVLCTVSEILKRDFRQTDCIARLGGDEFAVFLPNLPDEQTVVQRVKKVLRQFPVVLEDIHPIEVSASIGIAYKPKGTDMTCEELCHVADEAMYSAKRAGKAQAVIRTEATGEE